MSRWPARIVGLGAIAVIAVAALCTLDRGEDMTAVGAHSSAIDTLRVKVIERYPHARDAFTQGLIWHDDKLYESTGRRGKSVLRLVDLLSGQEHRKTSLDDSLFGEGIALIGDRIVQLTWTSHKALVYRKGDFSQVGEFSYTGEGWGLCHDGQRLIMSNGSSSLQFRDPDTFELLGRVEVTIRGRPQSRLNELECVDGYVYANVWEYDQIVRIDPATGNVTAVIDAGGLLTRAQRDQTDVLNGIAYMPERGHFLITGKLWPYIFEVEFVPR